MNLKASTIFHKGIEFSFPFKITQKILELRHDITENDVEVTRDDLDKATLKVSDGSDAIQEAFETQNDDDRDILIQNIGRRHNCSCTIIVMVCYSCVL